ncbi:unnamed protein product, partial [Vitis vinifera]|uniref:Uncharacterized protein n=1 Tax=Vitis vinifera TaxID=29760 RepID=E0CP88_VITVI
MLVVFEIKLIQVDRFLIRPQCNSTWRYLVKLNIFKKGPLFFGGLF